MANTNFQTGDLIQSSDDYIEGGVEINPPKKYGIILEPRHDMWDKGKKMGTKVRWTSGHQEIVWHFEIERANK
jgi:hypothetical protein